MIVLLAKIFVGQHCIGFIQYPQDSFRFFPVFSVSVRMPLLNQSFVGSLDLLTVGMSRHLKIVIVRFQCRRR